MPLAHRCELYLRGKIVGRWKIAVVLNEHAANDKHRVVRRGYWRHAIGYLSIPAGAADEVVSSLGSGGAFADVGKIRVVRRIGELHAVVATGHLWHMQDQRSFSQVEPAEDVECVMVDATG